MKRIPIINQEDKCNIENPIGYIYLITNTVNNKIYVGQHQYNKKHLDKSYHGSGSILKKAQDKYGLDKFKTIILDWAESIDDLNTKEEHWISYFDSFNSRYGYNMTAGGGGTKGFIASEDTKRKLSELRIGSNNSFFGKHHTEESKQKIRNNLPNLSGENNPNFGKMWNNEQRSNNNTARAVVQLTLDGKFVREYSYMGKASSYGFKPNPIGLCCRGSKPSYKGFRWMFKEDYYTALENGGIKDVATVINQGFKKGVCVVEPIQVVQLTLDNRYVKTFNSLGDANASLGIQRSSCSISNCCKGRNKTAYGFKWMYKEDYDKL